MQEPRKKSPAYSPQRAHQSAFSMGLVPSPDPMRQLFCTPLHSIVVSLMATKILITVDEIYMQILNAYNFITVSLLANLLYVLAVFVGRK
jgi:hypothetical protein